MKLHLSAVCLFVFTLSINNPCWATLPAGNPINATIEKTFWSVELEDVLTIPNSAGQAPRLEFLTAGGAPGLAYVFDQRGRIYSFDPAVPSPTPSVFLDLSSAVANFNVQGQTGVRGLAFHPDFNTPDTDGYRKFFTAHSRNGFAPGVGNPVFFPSPPNLNHDSVVGEWTVNANGTVNTGSYREVVRIGQPFDDHNIGEIGFNPLASPGDSDYGNLYVAMGDGGGALDPHKLAQNLATPHGSMLRINPLSSGGEPYSIPADNPLRVDSAVSNAQNMAWAYGLRNPHRFSWDPVSGKMLISDIGQGNIEEVNLGAPGANYGWSEREGTFITTTLTQNGRNIVDHLPADHVTDGFTYPVIQYDHNAENDNIITGAHAIVGGFVYRGTAIPELTGMYLFGEFATNHGPFYVVDIDDVVQHHDFSDLDSLYDGALAPMQELRLTQNGIEKTFLDIVNDALPFGSRSRTDLRFGLGPDNEIYVLNKHDGVVRRIVSATGLTAGDADRDGIVDGHDFLAWQRGAGLDQPDWSDGDFNASGAADATDLAAWQANFGSGTAVPATATPEPTAAALGVLGMFLGCLWRLSRRGNQSQ